MKSIIKRLLVLSLAIMLMMITCFSSTIYKDSIIVITPTQLKNTNLIFAEHSKLLKENSLLKRQIENYKEDNKLLIKSDSVRCLEINYYSDINKELNNSLQKKNKSLFLWKIGGITVSTTLLILFLFK